MVQVVQSLWLLALLGEWTQTAAGEDKGTPPGKMDSNSEGDDSDEGSPSPSPAPLEQFSEYAEAASLVDSYKNDVRKVLTEFTSAEHKEACEKWCTSYCEFSKSIKTLNETTKYTNADDLKDVETVMKNIEVSITTTVKCFEEYNDVTNNDDMKFSLLDLLRVRDKALLNRLKKALEKVKTLTLSARKDLTYRIQRIETIGLIENEGNMKAKIEAAEHSQGVNNVTGIVTVGVDLKSSAEVAANKKKSGLANSMGSFAGNDSDAQLKKYANAIGSQEGIDARNKVSANIDKVNKGYKAKTNLEGHYDKIKDEAERKGNVSASNVDGKYLKYNPNTQPADINGLNDATSSKSEFQNEKVKKGEVSKDNLEQIIASDTKENENKTSSYIKNLQDDTRLNVTQRKETPRLFTNRTGYVKSSWKASDKFAAWDVIGAVDALLEGATSIEADTGSVGRVGQSTDQNSYSAAQINYRGVKTDPQSGGY